MNVPSDLRYSTDHEWVRVDGSGATIGITEYAQDALGDVVFVDAMELGSSVTVGASITEVESTKSVSDIFAPVSGSIVAFNAALDSQPELLNSDPYGEGWICTIEMDDPTQIDGLMDAAQYQSFTESAA